MNQHRTLADASSWATASAFGRSPSFNRKAGHAEPCAEQAYGPQAIGRFRRILAICDDSVGSDDVLIRAIAVARASNARLTVVKSLLDHPGSLAALEEAKKSLSRIVPWIVQEGVPDVVTDVLVGSTDIEVCRYVLRCPQDLVIAAADVGRRKRISLRGSPAVSLMRRCPSAVWIVKDGQSSEHPVLAAVDAWSYQQTDPLDFKILETAAALAEAHNVGLHVVHSWDLPDGHSDRLKSELPNATSRGILEDCETKHRQALESLLAPYLTSHLRVKSHLPRGEPSAEIARIANELDAGLVVMGATCRVGILGLVMGCAAGTVFSEAPCGVVAVKTDHFRTPDTILRFGTDAKLQDGAES